MPLYSESLTFRSISSVAGESTSTTTAGTSVETPFGDSDIGSTSTSG